MADSNALPVTEKPKASTKDVLGQAKPNGTIPIAWRRHHRRLLELRDVLRRRQTGLAADAKDDKPAFSLHIGDAGTDQYDQDFALSMLSSDQSALYEIDEAISRIHGGTYGVCEVTGNRIEEERLDAIPWTRFSLEAQRMLEQEGAISRVKFSPRAQMAQGGGPAEEAEEEGEE